MNNTTVVIDGLSDDLDLQAADAEAEEILARQATAKKNREKMEQSAFLARILGMRWLVPLRKGKHSKGKIMKAKHAKQYAKKRSKTARASRRRNRGQS